MKKTRFATLLIVLSLSVVSGDLAWSESTQSVGQDEGNSVINSSKDQKANIPKYEDKFFIPIEPRGEGKFLLLDPDGKTPSSSEELLTPPAQFDKKPSQ
jgi:hypothetical protein